MKRGFEQDSRLQPISRQSTDRDVTQDMQSQSDDAEEEALAAASVGAGSEGGEVDTGASEDGDDRHSDRSDGARDLEYEIARARMRDEIRAAIPDMVEGIFRNLPPLPAHVLGRT